MAKQIYVGNLSFASTSDDLEKLFGQYGAVVSANVIVDKSTGRSRGFAFLTMGSDQEAQAAIAALNGKEFMGRPLTVNEARPRAERNGPRGA